MSKSQKDLQGIAARNWLEVYLSSNEIFFQSFGEVQGIGLGEKMFDFEAKVQVDQATPMTVILQV